MQNFLLPRGNFKKFVVSFKLSIHEKEWGSIGNRAYSSVHSLILETKESIVRTENSVAVFEFSMIQPMQYPYGRAVFSGGPCQLSVTALAEKKSSEITLSGAQHQAQKLSQAREPSL